MADDELVEAPYCVVCRRSSAVKWRKHVFSRGHQQAAQQFLLHQATRLQTLCDAATSDSLPADWWRCVFCDAALATVDALTHFGSEAHKKQVETFCRYHRCDADRKTRPQLWLRAARRRELETAMKKIKADDKEGDLQNEKQHDEVETVANKRIEAFLSSAASRLQKVESERRRSVQVTPVVEVATRELQQEELLGPQLALTAGVRRCKTVSSAEGVLQNPLGRHEGKRVWGGGIVKLRTAEWIPWAIDQLVKEEQVDLPETRQAGEDNSSFLHRVTEIARGEGLSSIASVSWSASVGNVHTGAVPPWMVLTEEEYKQCNRREQATSSLAPLTKRNNEAEAKDKKRRDTFTELQSKSEYGPDWLPNFGGVWQEGPRSKTKQSFRKAVNAAQLSCGRRPIEPSPSLIQRAPPANSQMLAPPLPPQVQEPAPSVSVDLPAKPQRAAPTTSPPELSKTDEAESKAANPLDAKKQLLLAQKERLRAKLAARRRK